MSYPSTKERLLLTVNPHYANKAEGTAGWQVLEMNRYLQKVSAIHPAVSYKALWAYVNWNYVVDDNWPLPFTTIQNIINDLEMRRNQTKLIMAKYVEWYKDPLMRWHMKKRYPRTKRQAIKALFDRDIKALWPTEKGLWPQTPSSCLL